MQLRLAGTLSEWRDDKACGFIECPDMTRRLFAHKSDFAEHFEETMGGVQRDVVASPLGPSRPLDSACRLPKSTHTSAQLQVAVCLGGSRHCLGESRHEPCAQALRSGVGEGHRPELLFRSFVSFAAMRTLVHISFGLMVDSRCRVRGVPAARGRAVRERNRLLCRGETLRPAEPPRGTADPQESRVASRRSRRPRALTRFRYWRGAA